MRDVRRTFPLHKFFQVNINESHIQITIFSYIFSTVRTTRGVYACQIAKGRRYSAPKYWILSSKYARKLNSYCSHLLCLHIEEFHSFKIVLLHFFLKIIYISLQYYYALKYLILLLNPSTPIVECSYIYIYS